MPEDKIPGGENSDAGGADQKDVVKYETYSKVVGEAKRAKEKASELEAELTKLRAADKDRQDAELKQKEDYKTLLANREAELAKEKAEKDQLLSEQRDARKLAAFLDSVDGRIDKKWWVHIDTSEVVINPDTNEIDQMSVTKAVEKFKAEYSEIIKKPGQSKMPNDAPGGKSGRISYDEWLKLPAKDMRCRRGDVDPATVPD